MYIQIPKILISCNIDNNINFMDSTIYQVFNGNVYNLPKACSAKKCDNLLVEADIFNRFRGLILCNAKHLQLDQYKKEHSCTAHQVLYSTTFSFFLIDGVVGSICVAQKISLRRLRCYFWWLLNKNIFTQISSYITVLNLEKCGAPIIHI